MSKPVLLAFLLLSAFSNCQNETSTDNQTEHNDAQSAEANQTESKAKLYHGIIEGKATIEVQLVTEDKKVNGFYINEKEGILYPIKGVKRDDGTLELSAYDDTGGTIELFIGKQNGKTIAGQWFNKSEGQSDISSTFKFTEKEIELAQKDLEFIKGTYEYTIEDYNSIIIIEPTSNHTVKLQGFVAYGSCTGEISGEAYIYNNKLINFFGEDDCFLKLEIGDNTINASEISCSYYHGHSCIFDGTYRKISEDLNWIITG